MIRVFFVAVAVFALTILTWAALYVVSEAVQ